MVKRPRGASMDLKTIDLTIIVSHDEDMRETQDIVAEAESYGRRRLSESPLHLLRSKESEKK